MNNIVFFGTEDFSLITLKALVEAGLPVVTVVTKPDAPRGRGHQLTPPVVKTFALEHSITVLQPTKIIDINDEILKLDKPVGILVSFGKIIPQSTIDLFSPGIINVHPSLLPKYRGSSPIESSILNGDHETAVSIMQLSAAMDAGPVYGYAPLKLTGKETRAELYATLGELGSQTLLKLLPLIISGEAVGSPQDDSLASYCQMITKSDGIIDWNKSASQIEREVRAYAQWPQSRTTLGKADVILTEVEITNDQGKAGTIETRMNELIAYTGEGALRILRLKPLGKKEMPISAFLTGYRSQTNL